MHLYNGKTVFGKVVANRTDNLEHPEHHIVWRNELIHIPVDLKAEFGNGLRSYVFV